MTEITVDRKLWYVVIDAHCAACANCARWIAAHDQRGEFRIIPLHSDLGRALMKGHDIDPDDPASWLLIHDGAAFTGLDAWFCVADRLASAQRLMWFMRRVPKPVREFGYRLVARNRRKFFPMDDLCQVPNAEVARRLVG